MLIHADWLGERGDLKGAGSLRGLAAAGYASLAAEPRADDFRCEYRPPHDSAVGYGRGDEYGNRVAYGYGEADGFD